MMGRSKQIESLENIYILTKPLRYSDSGFGTFKEEFFEQINKLLFIPYKTKKECVQALTTATGKPLKDIIREFNSKGIKNTKELEQYVTLDFYVNELRGEKHIIENLGNDLEIEIRKAEKFSIVSKKVILTDRRKAELYDALKENVFTLLKKIEILTALSMLPSRHSPIIKYPLTELAFGQLLEYEFEIMDSKDDKKYNILSDIEDAESSIQHIESYNLGFRSAMFRLNSTMVYEELKKAIDYQGECGFETRIKTQFKTNRDFAPYITRLFNATGSVSEACRMIANNFLTIDGYPLNANSLKVEYTHVINDDYVDEINKLKKTMSVDEAIQEISDKTGVKVYELRKAYNVN